jgi:glycosyltransferase involved in cell wall biosynthesis
LARALNVFHLDTELTWRGGEGQLLALARGMLRRGHRATVVAQPDGELAKRSVAAGVPTELVRMRGEWDLGAVRRLAALFRRERPDVVHLHTSHAHTLGVLAARWARVGRTVVSRRVDFSIHRHALSLSGFKYRHGVDRYVAVSDAVKRQLVKDGVDERRIVVVHDGVDPQRCAGGDGAKARAELGVPSDAPLVGAVAHLAWHKSLETLVDAAEAIVAHAPDAWVAIVGEGEERPLLESRRAASRAKERILLPGFRSNVADFLAAFDVFVVPSVMEGLCSSILDCFAVGLPVVACRAGGIPELVEHEKTGLLVEPRQPKLLADAIVRVLDEPPLQRELAEKGRAVLLARFTEDVMVEGTLAQYAALVDGAAASATSR